tara:strand:- start:185 stop:397 length:213 start_codon:yes stop_codon:yes gene_type:complete
VHREAISGFGSRHGPNSGPNPTQSPHTAGYGVGANGGGIVFHCCARLAAARIRLEEKEAEQGAFCGILVF